MRSQIVINADICHGQPTIAGTRTPVQVILAHIAGGDSFEAICREYDLTESDIRAAVAFANDQLTGLTFVAAPQRKGA